MGIHQGGGLGERPHRLQQRLLRLELANNHDEPRHLLSHFRRAQRRLLRIAATHCWWTAALGVATSCAEWHRAAAAAAAAAALGSCGPCAFEAVELVHKLGTLAADARL